MRKIGSVLIIFFVILCLTCCSATVAPYEFLYTPEEIISIEIVAVGEEFIDGVIEHSTICKIEDTEKFINEFYQLDCYMHFTDPEELGTNVVSIKLNYKDGEYELISAEGQARYTKERQFQYYKGYRYFDQEQFDNLISKYTNNN